jgi:hypothetical protein
MDAQRLFRHTIWGEPIDEPFDAAHVPPGHFDARVLDQGQTWVDGQGGAHLLVDLDPAWRRNIALSLYRRARNLHKVCGLCEAFGVSESAASFIAMAGFRVPRILDQNPYTWLEGTVFFQGLRSEQPDISDSAALKALADASHHR